MYIKKNLVIWIIKNYFCVKKIDVYKDDYVKVIVIESGNGENMIN